MLSPLDCVSDDGIVRKCISVAQYGRHNVRINKDTTRTSTTIFDFNHIVPDIGATSYMRCNRMDFEDDYVTYNDVFCVDGRKL